MSGALAVVRQDEHPSARTFEPLLQPAQVLLVGAADRECHEWREPAREARRNTSISEPHLCSVTRNRVPRVGRFHRKWPARGTHHESLAADELDNVRVLEAAPEKVRHERDA